MTRTFHRSSRHLEMRMAIQQRDGFFDRPGLQDRITGDAGLAGSRTAAGYRRRLVEGRAQVHHGAAKFLVPPLPCRHPAFICSGVAMASISATLGPSNAPSDWYRTRYLFKGSLPFSDLFLRRSVYQDLKP
jgi:hypothetical protein